MEIYTISIISWWSVSLVEETGVNNKPTRSPKLTLLHIFVSIVHHHGSGESNSQTLVVIDTGNVNPISLKQRTYGWLYGEVPVTRSLNYNTIWELQQKTITSL